MRRHRSSARAAGVAAHPRRTTLVPAALLATLAATVAPSSARAELAWRDCGDLRAQQCASLDVPLDRGGELAGTITLQLRRLPATAAPPGAARSRTAMVGLAGGPGQPAIPLLETFATQLAAGRADRDLVVFDPRGTGQSEPLACPSLTEPGASPLDVRAAACAARIGRARGRYTTADAAADLESVRRAAGYEALTLFGVSYGTKTALAYAASRPRRVERLVLDSVVAPDGPDALLRPTFAAVRRVLAALCVARRCSGVSGGPVRDLAMIVRRLAAAPGGSRTVAVTDGSARRRPLGLSRRRLLALVVGSDLNPALRTALPAALDAGARRDDLRPLARLAWLTGASSTSGAALQSQGAGVRDALFVTTLCEEVSFPWDRGSADPLARASASVARVNGLPARGFAPFDRPTALSGGLLPLCLRWRPVSPPPPPTPPALPDVPALLLSGSRDLRTPLEDARAVAARLARGRVLEVPATGHSTVRADATRCAAGAVALFLNGGEPPACPASVESLGLARRVPAVLRDAPRARGLGVRTGRTVGAALATVSDARHAALVAGAAVRAGAQPLRAGGLRSGSATLDRSGLRLRAFSSVSGVAVSGFVPARSGRVASLRITGRAAARGRVVLRAGGRLEGTLGGRRIRVRLATRP